MGEFSFRPCPTCGCTARDSGAVVSGPSALDLTLDQLRPHWRGFFGERVFFPYGRCARCGQLYCPVYFDAAQLDELYASMPDNTAGVDVEPLRRTQGRYAAVLRRFAPADGDFLELGPDIGLFAERAAAGRDGAALYLVEPNRDVWPELEARLGASRCRLLASLDGASSIPDGSVGMAAMIHVLDHMLDPLGLLRQVARTLAPGGALAVVTHDESSLMARVLGPRWLPYCLQHPQLFRASSLRELFAAADLEVVAQEKTSNDFPVAYLVKHGLAAAGLPSGRVPDVQRPSVALKLGNLITVARRAGERGPALN